MNIERAKGHGRHATLSVKSPGHFPNWHVKLRPSSDSQKVTDEAIRTQWASERLPSPKDAHIFKLPGLSILITETLEGRSSHKYIEALPPTAILSGLASAVELMRLADVTDFPFAPPRWTTDQGIEENFKRLAASKTKHRELHPDFAGRTYKELHDIVNNGPTSNDKVLAHGDLCMPNVLLDGQAALTGIVDLGGLHIGNADLDLAIISWTVQANMGDNWANRLLDMHGTTADNQGILYDRLVYDLGLEQPQPWSWTHTPQLAAQRERLAT